MVLIAIFSGGLEGDILVALFLVPLQQVEGSVSVPRIKGSSVGVHPSSVPFAALRVTLLSERRKKVPVVEVIAESAPEVAVYGEEPAGLRNRAAGREG